MCFGCSDQLGVFSPVSDTVFGFCTVFSFQLTASDATVVGEIVVPGRLARGERFDFERYVSRLECWCDGDRLFADATHLIPDESDPTAPGVMGEYAVYGTLYVIMPDVDSTALANRIHKRIAEGEADSDAGATTLPNDAGVAVCALGHRAEPVIAALHGAWEEARRDLLDVGAPDGRKL